MLTLTAASECLALLALGLVRPWGEVVPRWIPLLGGRCIPIRAVLIPAALGVLGLFAAYAYLVLNRYVFHLHFAPGIGTSGEGTMPKAGLGYWVIVACYSPLLAWGPLLAAVTAAYYRRRTRAGKAARLTVTRLEGQAGRMR